MEENKYKCAVCNSTEVVEMVSNERGDTYYCDIHDFRYRMEPKEIPTSLDALRRLLVIYRDQQLMATTIKKYVPKDELVLWGMVPYEDIINSYANEEFNTIYTYEREMKKSGLSKEQIDKEIADIYRKF